MSGVSVGHVGHVEPSSLEGFLKLINHVRLRDRILADEEEYLDPQGYLILNPLRGDNTLLIFHVALELTRDNLCAAAEALLPFFYERDCFVKFLLRPEVLLKAERGAAGAGAGAGAGEDFERLDLSAKALCIAFLYQDHEKASFLKKVKETMLSLWGILKAHGVRFSSERERLPVIPRDDQEPGFSEMTAVSSVSAVRFFPFSYFLAGKAGEKVRALIKDGRINFSENDLRTYGVYDPVFFGKALENPILTGDLLRDHGLLTIDFLRGILNGYFFIEQLNFLEQAFDLITGNQARTRYELHGRPGSIFANRNLNHSDQQLDHIKILKETYSKILEFIESRTGRGEISAGLLDLMEFKTTQSPLLSFNRTRYRAFVKNPTHTQTEAGKVLKRARDALAFAPVPGGLESDPRLGEDDKAAPGPTD